MSPDTFAALLDRATGTPPPSPPPSDALRAGRTRLRHRRLGAAVTVCAMVLAVGGAATALPDRDSAHDVASAWTDESVLHRCLAGDQNGPGEDALRASGTPVVEAWVRTDLKISAAISSADGTMWAECWIWLMPQASGETSAGMSFYDATQRSAGRAGGWHVGTGCGVPETQERGCAYWALSTVDKLPPEVAAVRYELGDGTSVTLPTTNGFAVLNVRHPLPAVGRVDSDGVVKGFDWGRQITYLDADGAVLAAARLDNPRNPDVPGLPPLRDYRSLGRSWVP